jgi:hypothetical protein
MTRPVLNFSNGNNAALSLRTIAELCRRGDAEVIMATESMGGKLTLSFKFRSGAEPTIEQKPIHG